MRHALAYLPLLLILAGISCQRQEPVVSGALTLTFSTSLPQTRATTPGDGNVQDGGGIAVDGESAPDLVIAIADKTGDIVAWYPDANGVAVPNSLCLIPHPASVPVTESSIRFTGLGKGTYSVYAFANTGELDGAFRTALLEAARISDLDELQLEAATGTPSFDGRMPLSARGSVSVNEKGNGQIDLELLRVVAKVSLTFVNKTGEPLLLHDCSAILHGINPSRGYLLPHKTDYVTGCDRDLLLDNAGLTIPVLDPEDPTSVNTAEVKEPVLVFPSIAPTVQSRYLGDISFKVAKAGEESYDPSNPETYTAYSFTDLPIHDRYSQDIPSLMRNQYLKIETRIARKTTEYDISFNFEVCDWTATPVQTITFH